MALGLQPENYTWKLNKSVNSRFVIQHQLRAHFSHSEGIFTVQILVLPKQYLPSSEVW